MSEQLDETAQLALFDLEVPGWPPLEVDPTPAMKRGEQLVFQHSWCGAVLIVPIGTGGARQPRGCPCCDRPDDGWWQQSQLVAGLRYSPAQPTPPTSTGGAS